MDFFECSVLKIVGYFFDDVIFEEIVEGCGFFFWIQFIEKVKLIVKELYSVIGFLICVVGQIEEIVLGQCIVCSIEQGFFVDFVICVGVGGRFVIMIELVMLEFFLVEQIVSIVVLVVIVFVILFIIGMGVFFNEVVVFKDIFFDCVEQFFVDVVCMVLQIQELCCQFEKQVVENVKFQEVIMYLCDCVEIVDKVFKESKMIGDVFIELLEVKLLFFFMICIVQFYCLDQDLYEFIIYECEYLKQFRWEIECGVFLENCDMFGFGMMEFMGFIFLLVDSDFVEICSLLGGGFY